MTLYGRHGGRPLHGHEGRPLHDKHKHGVELTQYIECLATMGEFNPVFEKAGMRRIGQYDLSPKQREALEALRKMDVDPSGRAFVTQVSRRPPVRKIVAKIVYDWYAATTAGGASRVERQSPEFLAQTFRGLIGSRPVYYLWRQNGTV